MPYIIDPINLSITVTPESTINDILKDNPNTLIFYFPDGKYYLTKKLDITVPNIQFVGLSNNPKYVHIFQKKSKKDGLNVITNNFTMKYISIHVPHDNKIALTVSGGNNTVIQNCYFYGNKTTSSVNFTGPINLVAGTETMDAYKNKELNKNNKFINNVVYSGCPISVVFALQIHGYIDNNIIRGGNLDIYMCYKCHISNNIIYDSVDLGIKISLPSKKLIITSNKIYESINGGIKISNQQDHGIFLPKKCDITIENNYIYDTQNNAIELNDVNNCIVKNNTFTSTNVYGIYALRSTNLTLCGNKIAYFNVAFWIETSSHCDIFENTCMSVYLNEGQNVVKLTTDSNNNQIYNNNVMGKVIYDKYIIPSETTGNTEHDNNYIEYYDIVDEINIMK